MEKSTIQELRQIVGKLADYIPCEGHVPTTAVEDQKLWDAVDELAAILGPAPQENNHG